MTDRAELALKFSLLEKLVRDSNAGAAAKNVTDAEGRVMTLLMREDGVRTSSIAKVLKISPQAAYKEIVRLETRGMIERRPSATHSQALLVFLTDYGRKAAEDFSGEGNGFSVLTDEEADDLDACIDRILTGHPEICSGAVSVMKVMKEKGI